MLGKLLKQDAKALSRYLVPLHAAVVVLAVFGRLFITQSADWSDPSPLLIIYIIGFTLILVTMMTGTSLIIAVYFYRNLFSKHGYLSWTIPASAGQHLASKTIAGYIWLVLDYMIAMAAAALFLAVPSIPWSEISDSYSEEMGFSLFTFLLILSGIAVVSCFCGIMSYYVAIAAGQLFSNHRVLGAVIVYCVLTFLVQIFVSIALFIGPNGFGFVITDTLNASDQNITWGVQYIQMMWRIGFASLIEGIIFYVITYYIMNKRLNLS